jgi:hypothetical protein
MVSTPQRHQHRKDAPVKEQRVLSAPGDRLPRALDKISVRAGTKMYLIVLDDNVTLKFTPRLEEASTFREERI